VAAATGGNVAEFKKAVAGIVTARGPFVSASLWQLSGASPRLVAAVSGEPLLAPGSARLAALLRQSAASTTFVVTKVAAPGAVGLAFAAAASGPHGRFVVYAEEPLPADGRVSDPAGSPLGPLSFAVYLGRAQTPGTLLETDSAGLLRGTFIKVGDVSGRGVEAAAVMASLHFAGRAYALEGHSPRIILDQLAQALDVTEDGHFATVLASRMVRRTRSPW